jgi:hypothetical protein
MVERDEMTVCVWDERATNEALREGVRPESAGRMLCGRRDLVLMQVSMADGSNGNVPMAVWREGLVSPEGYVSSRYRLYYGGVWDLSQWLIHTRYQGNPSEGVGGYYRMCPECAVHVQQALDCGVVEGPES